MRTLPTLRRWAILLVRTPSAEFSVRPMAGRTGREFSIKMKTPARLTLRLILRIPTFFLRDYGRRGARRGAWTAAVRAAGCIARLMAETRGSILKNTGFRKPPSDALAWPWLT